MTQTETSPGSYADVNGLRMYYEIHGQGNQPLILMHGAFSAIGTSFGKFLPLLAKNRRIVAVELQGHGHTADIDRPLTYANMADDVAELIRQLSLGRADLFGYSMGGAVALELALHYPERVRKAIFAGGASYRPEGMYPEMASMGEMPPDALNGTPWHEEYMRIAPHPGDWPKLMARIQQQDREHQGWTAEQLRSIKAPFMLAVGDADIVRPEHVAEMFRLLGGGVAGDLVGLPRAWLAVLPGTTHVTLLDRADWLIPMVQAFLDAPVPEESQ